jgi:hypothetical protein
MKPMNALATLVLAAGALIMLNACSGTSNSAATPAASCSINSVGQYVDQNGNVCNPGTQGSTTCPATGYYPVNGQNVACTPGSLVNTGGYTGYGTSYGAPSGYSYGSNPSNGCTTYYQIYGELYVPMYLNGSLVCANYNDLMASMQSSSYYASSYQSTPYYQNGYSQAQIAYMYAYPPTAYTSGYGGGGYGGGCNSGSASFYYQDFGASVCL